MTRDDIDDAVDRAEDEDVDREDDGDLDEDLDYTYFCAACGHEQLDGDVCEACGSDDWEFVRLDDEGMQRLAEVRGEVWEPGMRLSPAVARGKARLSSEFESALVGFIDDLAQLMAAETLAAEEAPTAEEADDSAETAVGNDAEQAGDEDVEQAGDEDVEEAGGALAEARGLSDFEQRRAAEERFRAWMESHRDWLLQEVAQADLESED